MKKIAIIITLLVIGSIGIVGFLNNRTSPPEESIDEKVLQTILSNIPEFSHESKPGIKLASVSSFEDKWYVATLSSLHETKNQVPVKVVLMRSGDSDSELKIMSGPEIYYSENQVISLNLPDAVILELLKQ